MISPSPLVSLNMKFEKEPWFHSVDQDQFGRFIVYAKYMGSEVYAAVPSTYEGKQLLLHFAGYATAVKDGFTTTPKLFVSLPQSTEIKYDEEDGVDLHEELWKLKKICGLDNLINIFHEVHDTENKVKPVTNLSKDFLEVELKIKKLYDEFGFDVLYDQLGD